MANNNPNTNSKDNRPYKNDDPFREFKEMVIFAVVWLIIVIAGGILVATVFIARFLVAAYLAVLCLALPICPTVDLARATLLMLSVKQRRRRALSCSPFPDFRRIKDQTTLDSRIWSLIENSVMSLYPDDIEATLGNLRSDPAFFESWKRKHLRQVLHDRDNQGALNQLCTELWLRFRDESSNPNIRSPFWALMRDKLLAISKTEDVFVLTKRILHILSFRKLWGRVSDGRTLQW